MREQHTGHAAATMSITAERQRALEMAYERAEQSVAVLRLYQDATYRPEEISVGMLYGQHHVPSRVGFLAKNLRLSFAEQGFAKRAQEHRWIISDSDVQDFQQLGMPQFHALLTKPKRTKFEDDVLGSILVYTKSATKLELSDRLVYTFTALDSLLTRDSNEHLGQNVGDRIAF